MTDVWKTNANASVWRVGIQDDARRWESCDDDDDDDDEKHDLNIFSNTRMMATEQILSRHPF